MVLAGLEPATERLATNCAKEPSMIICSTYLGYYIRSVWMELQIIKCV